MRGGKKPTNTSEKDPSKIVGEGSLSTGGTRAARAARAAVAKKEQNSNSNNDSKSLNNTINGVKEVINDIKGNSSKLEEKQTKTENENNSSSDDSAKTVDKQDYDKLMKAYDDKLHEIAKLKLEVDASKREVDAVRYFNRDLLKQLDDSEKNHDTVLKQYNDLNKLFEEYKSKQPQETTKTTSEPNVEESQIDTTAQTEEPKVNNSANAEETVTPEGEAKTTGESEVKTEQAQATQESAKEANARPGTGEVTKDNIISPEDAFKFFNNKENYDKASTVFKTPSFDEYIDSTTGKWIPRSYFDAFNARDGIDPKKFTFEHFKAKIPEDPGKPLTAEEKTADLYNRTKAAEDYDKEYEKYNTGFKAYLRRHPKIAKMVKTGGAIGILGTVGAILNSVYTAGQNDKDELQNIINSLNDDEPEYPGSSSGNNSPENIAAQLKGADESTKTPKGDSGTIEQAIAEQAPAGNVEPENPQVAANTATLANNAPASTVESAPTQGLPPVVTRDAPPANPDSSGMTYSQRVESEGQAPQAGSMAYNANNPDMVTADLVNAMNQAPQAGSDAIGYGDLYDQNFIDFWAKRNPNLAYGVSQGRR